MERPVKTKRQLKAKMLPKECPCCGTDNPWIINSVDFVAPFRDRKHFIQATVYQCRHCDEIVTTDEQSSTLLHRTKEAHNAWISAHLRKRMKELGLSLRGLAEKSSVTFATLGRISSGDHSIDASTERLLWMEIDKISQSQKMESWLHMEQPPYRIADGHIQVTINPEKTSLYSKILKTAAQSPLGRSSDEAREAPCLDYSLGSPIAA